jgi:S-adenosylmethionine decarboxylase proenzyme
VRDVLLQAAREAGAAVVGEQFHRFSPVGYTGCILLAESHIAVHSWVDEGLLTVDVFACRAEQSRAIVERLCADLGLERRRMIEVRRGEESDHVEKH